jgi:hypothetical protein
MSAEMKKGLTLSDQAFSAIYGVPTGIRTPVTAVKGRCPRPLDDGDLVLVAVQQPYYLLLTT